MCSILDPSQCKVFRWSTFSVVRSCELKNNIFCRSTPPEHCLHRLLHSLKCTAWVAISKHGIIGLFWFEDDNEHCVTINIDWYIQVLRNFWTTLCQRKRCSASVSGSSRTCHSTHLKRINNMVKSGFYDRLISHKCDPQWSPT